MYENRTTPITINNSKKSSLFIFLTDKLDLFYHTLYYSAAAEAPEDPNKVPSPLAIEPNILGAAAAGAAAAGAAIDEFLLEFLLELLATALGRAVVGAIEVARMALDPIELAVDPKELAAVDILYSVTIFCTNPLG